MNFTLHTEPGADVPEFTISCLTYGGPATNVEWTVNGVSVQEDSDHETSQLILDTSLNSVYDNRLRVRGRRNGTYNCIISNNIRDFVVGVNEVRGSFKTLGKLISCSNLYSFSHSCRRAHQSYCSHLSVQQCTCYCHCVLEVTRW